MKWHLAGFNKYYLNDGIMTTQCSELNTKIKRLGQNFKIKNEKFCLFVTDVKEHIRVL